MKKQFVVLFALAAIAAIPLMADAIDGTWVRGIGKKGHEAKLILKGNGAKLTGTFDPGGGRIKPIQISDGKVDGLNVSFKVVRDLNGKDKMTQIYSGTFSAFELKLVVQTESTLDEGDNVNAGMPDLQQVFVRTR